jgi:hypothetical protein
MRGRGLLLAGCLGGLLAACRGGGSGGQQDGSPSVACNVSEQLSLGAAAVAGPGSGGTQSGGTNNAGGDTNVTVFCGKDSSPIFTGPGGSTTTTKNSGNTTTSAEARR